MEAFYLIGASTILCFTALILNAFISTIQCFIENIREANNESRTKHTMDK